MSAIISTQTLHQEKESVATCGMETVETIQDIYIKQVSNIAAPNILHYN